MRQKRVRGRDGGKGKKRNSLPEYTLWEKNSTEGAKKKITVTGQGGREGRVKVMRQWLLKISWWGLGGANEEGESNHLRMGEIVQGWGGRNGQGRKEW